MRIINSIKISVILIFGYTSLFGQAIHDILAKAKIEFEEQNYYTSLNFCRNIIELCKTNPESECWYTNVMKNVYRYKGLAEFEIYKKELKINRLENAIQSLEASYILYADPEILYSYGYLLAIKSILKKDKTDLDGLVKAWKGILEIYGRDNWIVSKILVEKIKDYVRISEKFVFKEPSVNYTGKFAQYMIILSCNLADKAQLDTEDQKFFIQYKSKYNN